jgi:ribosomal protein S20
MANTYSALKRVRQTERRTEFNRKNKSKLRHQIRAMRRAVDVTLFVYVSDRRRALVSHVAFHFFSPATS